MLATGARTELVKEWPGIRHALAAVRFLEAWWFDTTRRVQTAGEVSLDQLTLAGSAETGHRYAPVRPVAARRLFRALPPISFPEYTFVDFGSGKGRMLLLAAERSFREIHGVEFATELHAIAESNIQRYRSSRQQCRAIHSFAMDARDYSFPNSPLVVYFYNPFADSVMADVLRRLETSLDIAPRDVLLILLYPEQAHLLTDSQYFTPHCQTFHFHIYRSRGR